MSPQPLQPKIRGQATPADPYAGWGMSAAQNDLPAGLDFIRQLVKKFTNPNDPMQPMPMGNPIGAGMVLSEQNIPKILARMAEVSPDAPEGAANYALKYMVAKYPKLFGLPEHVAIKNATELAPSQMGGYIPESNVVQISNGITQPHQAVNTLAHELTHALQKSRGETFRDYIPRDWNEFEYRLQPVEQQARQAGQTASKTFSDFVAKVAAMRASQGK